MPRFCVIITYMSCPLERKVGLALISLTSYSGQQPYFSVQSNTRRRIHSRRAAENASATSFEAGPILG